MRLFRSNNIIGVASETMDFIYEVCRDTHPNEFMGLLRATDARDLGLERKGSVITDVLVIPGTRSGQTSATLRDDMVPMNSGDVGTVHSHPSRSSRPSDEDLHTFSKRGKCHIIVAYPYDSDSWTCYNREGEVRELEVIDVELEDEYFDFGELDEGYF